MFLLLGKKVMPITLYLLTLIPKEKHKRFSLEKD